MTNAVHEYSGPELGIQSWSDQDLPLNGNSGRASSMLKSPEEEEHTQEYKQLFAGVSPPPLCQPQATERQTG